MPAITPSLWFDNDLEDAIAFYSSIFPNSSVDSIERYTEAYVAQLKAFAQCILEDTPSPVTGIDGRTPVVMGYAAKKSYEEKRPVKLSEVDVGSDRL